MPRLFTALEVPAEVRQQLALHKGGLTGARWVEPSDYHITLRFLGDVDGRTARDVTGYLADIQPMGPLTLTIDEIASFGGDKPRALYARVQPHADLGSLQADHERLMRNMGLEPETRRYRPHVTLARLKDAMPFEVAQFLSSRPLMRPISFQVRRFVLFSSRASVGGGPYVIEAAYPFA
jgi:RNA 2',3'-cyclic 3'-phosphodiesterase